jgi:hypothetical protein
VRATVAAAAIAIGAVAGVTAGVAAVSSSPAAPPVTTSAQAAPSRSPWPQRPVPLTPSYVAWLVGASHLTGTRRGEQYAYEEALASWDGRPVMIVTFRSDKLRDHWLRVSGWAGTVAITGHCYVVRNN